MVTDDGLASIQENFLSLHKSIKSRLHLIKQYANSLTTESSSGQMAIIQHACHDFNSQLESIRKHLNTIALKHDSKSIY